MHGLLRLTPIELAMQSLHTLLVSSIAVYFYTHLEIEIQRHTHLPSSSMMLTVMEPLNEAGGATLPVRVKLSVLSTRGSSRMLAKIVIVLPSLAPIANVTSVRDRLKS